MDANGNTGYSIKAVSEVTGLSVETLRAWERRYQVIQPKRDLGGRRIYSSGDVSRLRRLREITARGHPISKIAGLSDDDLSSLLAERTAANRAGAAAADALVARILLAVDAYQPVECAQLVAQAFALWPLGAVVRTVLSPLLQEVGARWRRGEYTIAQERIASSAARAQLTSLLNTFSVNAAHGALQSPALVFATLSGEQHELGILMHAAWAASRLSQVYYLGTDLPPEEIGRVARKVEARAVVLSLVMSRDLEQSLEQIHALHGHLQTTTHLWIGGAGIAGIDRARLPAGNVTLADSGDFEQQLKLLSTAG